MQPKSDREMWERSQTDEAAALREQQRNAGGTHSPVKGPGPYGDHGTNIAAETAVGQERERCARLAEHWARQHPDASAGLEQILLDLAAAIRRG